MKKPMRRLIRGLVILLAVSLPRTSDAESVYGSWQGTAATNLAFFVNGQEVEHDIADLQITLTMLWYGTPSGGPVDFGVPLFIPFQQTGTQGDPFGPQSASFSGADIAPGDFAQSFNFYANYSYIDPNGNIVGGSATADFTLLAVLNHDPSDYTTISDFVSFSSPEPSSIVTMGLGLLTVLVFARRSGGPFRPFGAKPRRSD
jgi:hypothetical protein